MPISKLNTSACVLEDEALFMSDEGNKKLDFLRKELEVYADLLNKIPLEMYKKTAVRLNPACADPNYVGEEDAKKMVEWFMNIKSKEEFAKWLLSRKHKVDGKYGNWSAGFLGSRWADCEINGRNCRLAFYSFKTDEIETNDKSKQYLIMIDPS